ncbi:hypothetical protein KX928_21875 [Roseobacter sp. YSTF-M11]|uniref:Uncharacterized protein n=1 Tax=Roseobacter insulae TaxID=2859783 RepID=A0A9X1FZG7_9RHOB|nr:hypothetical protein [Roseobacter insulae]MBW4710448.1 hypothetical protein [Roseobacter insulae]
MQVVDRFPASGFLNGPRTLVLRSLPPGARLKSFRLLITPIADESGAVGPGLEALTFPAGSGPQSDVAIDPAEPARPTGVTRTSGTGALPWTEVAFNGFRALQNVGGIGLAGAALQVDVGGLFVAVDANGTIPQQSGDFPLPGDTADLPGLSVQRMRLVAPDAVPPLPLVTDITLRAVASNLTVALGEQPAVWARPGDVTTAVETTELVEFAQAALAVAPVEHGFAVLPVTVKTDTTARLGIEIRAEYDETSTSLPAGLPEMTLDYSHDGIADAGDGLLKVKVPDGMELDPDKTRVEIAGTFENSQISFGALADRSPQGALDVPAGHAVATPLAMIEETVADAVDVLLSTSDRNAGVEIDLREDFDGKPGDVSLLATRATGSLDVSRHGTPRWLNAALGQAVTLPAANTQTGKPRFWIVVQSVAGSVTWHLNPERDGTAEAQTSDNGGLSWRPARATDVPGALAPQVRLRRASPVFNVPVRAEIDRGSAAEILELDAFQPLGRVEFSLDSERFTTAVNAALDRRLADACPRGEHLINGGFADREEAEVYRPAGWTASGDSVGRRVFGVRLAPELDPDDVTILPVTLVRVGTNEDPAESLSQVLTVSPGCPYRLTFRGFGLAPGGRIEVIWRSADCGVAGVDVLEPPPASVIADPVVFSAAVSGGPILAAIPAATLDTTAPAGAQQAEVRLVASPDDSFFVDVVSLTAGTRSLANPDMREAAAPEDGTRAIKGWETAPQDAFADAAFSFGAGLGGVTLSNRDTRGRTLVLRQGITVIPGTRVAAGLETTAPADGPDPVFSIVWHGSERAPLTTAVSRDGAEITRLAGTVPDTVRQAEVQIALAQNATLTVVAVAVEAAPPAEVPVAFLSEAPGRLTVRDFTVGFRPRPVPQTPVAPGTPCAVTPPDAAPGDVCEPDPCCGKSGAAEPATATAVTTVSALPPTATIASLRPATTPALSVMGTLPAASASARLAAVATRMSLAGTRPRRVLRVAETAVTLRAALPVGDINGVGEVRTTQLATVDIRTVGDLARIVPEDLVRRLGYTDALAQDLVAKAKALMEDQTPS